MIRQLSLITMVAALAAPGLSAQTARPQPIDIEKRTIAAEQVVIPREELSSLSRKARAVRAATDPAATLAAAQAPGVIQGRFTEEGIEAFFVVTERIVAGSKLQFAFTFPNDDYLYLGTRELTSDFLPGEYFRLPTFEIRSRWWRPGYSVINVYVIPRDGERTRANYEFASEASLRDREGVAWQKPGINSWRQFYAEDGSVMVEIKGRFVTSPAGGTHIVFNSYVVPQDAIQIVNSSTIIVNFSQAYLYDWDAEGNNRKKYYPKLEYVLDQLLTISQESWGDTIPFRYTPSLP